MQIESLSKRLDRKLYCRVTKTDVPLTTENYWRVVRVFQMDEWKEMSAAAITLKVVDPALDQFAAKLNEWEKADVAALPKLEDVPCFLCTDGTVPIRMLMVSRNNDTEVVVVIELLARKTDES